MTEENAKLAEALAKLKERQVRAPDFFQEGATDQQIEEANGSLPVSIPAMWQQVLKTYNGFCLANIEFTEADGICLPEEVGPTFVEELAPAGAFFIGGHASGDVVMLDIARQTSDGDCPVIWVSHEDDKVGSGRSIPNFLLDWIESDALDDE